MTERRMASMRPFFSRSLALILLALVVGLVYGGMVEPLRRETRDWREQADQSEALLDQYQRLHQSLPGLQARFEALQKSSERKGATLSGGSDALAAAGLQEQIKRRIEGAGGQLKSTQILPVIEEGVYRRISLRVQVQGELEALQAVLYSVEDGRPYLFVDNLDLRKRRQSRSRRNAGSAQQFLELRFDLFGYRRGSEGRGGEG